MSGEAAGPATDPLERVTAELAKRNPQRIAPGLDRIRALTEALGSPQRAYPSVHITGTNGKTSTARMIDALLRATGLRTGRFTSPHLESVTERISLDGAPLSAEAFAAAFDDVIDCVRLVDDRSPERVSFFELLTAMAFAAFADAPVDVAVMEVGLGGRLDATNVVAAPVAVVTRVDLDHPQLGPTVADVAGEKAGIIHPGSIAILAEQDPSAAAVLRARVQEVGAQARWAGRDYALVERRPALGGQMISLRGVAGDYPEVFLGLHGAHQAANAAGALAAVEAFLGDRELDVELVRAAFAAVDSPGRLELVGTHPPVLIDGAHNPAGASALATALAESFAATRWIGVLGVLSTKDAEGILRALEPVFDELIVTDAPSPRSRPPGELAELARTVFSPRRVAVEPVLAEALAAALRRAERSGGPGGAGVCVSGSLTIVGAARAWLRARGGAGVDPGDR